MLGIQQRREQSTPKGLLESTHQQPIQNGARERSSPENYWEMRGKKEMFLGREIGILGVQNSSDGEFYLI